MGNTPAGVSGAGMGHSLHQGVCDGCPETHQSTARARSDRGGAPVLRRAAAGEIAAKLGVSQQQVSYDVHRLLREGSAGHRADIDCYIGEMLQRINWLEAEHWTHGGAPASRSSVSSRSADGPCRASPVLRRIRSTASRSKKAEGAVTRPFSRVCSGASASAAGSSGSVDRASDVANDDVCHNPDAAVHVAAEYAKRGYGKDVAHGSRNARQPHLSL